MNKWNDYFKIEEYWEGLGEGKIGLLNPDEYKLIEISTGKTIGSYKDQEYAEKQAKYKFKKLSKKIEKILLFD